MHRSLNACPQAARTTSSRQLTALRVHWALPMRRIGAAHHRLRSAATARSQILLACIRSIATGLLHARRETRRVIIESFASRVTQVVTFEVRANSGSTGRSATRVVLEQGCCRSGTQASYLLAAGPPPPSARPRPASSAAKAPRLVDPRGDPLAARVAQHPPAARRTCSRDRLKLTTSPRAVEAIAHQRQQCSAHRSGTTRHPSR